MTIDWETRGMELHPAVNSEAESPNEWENPLMTGENKLPQTAYRNYDRTLSLNGIWKFQWYSSPDLLPENPDEIPFTETMEVPSHPELNGFGVPIYTNIQYPFPPRSPLVPHDSNAVSNYRREFELPGEWRGKRIFISFQGVDSFFRFFVNGVFAGSSKGSRNPAEFELTDLVAEGKNTIQVQVYRWSDATYIEDQDMWWLSGIFRDVYLYAEEDSAIKDFEVRTSLEELRVKVRTAYEGPVKISLDGVFEDEFDPDFEYIRKVDVESWSAETPKLYTLALETPGDRIVTRIGFRTVRIENGELLINNRPVLLRGVNRHEFNCRRGRAITEEDMLWDIRTMKAHNINAVRCSHYPNRNRWYELCDEYGLYVFDEADLESHGMKDALSRDPRWRKAYLDRVERMLERNKNHPCVIAWSIGNESGFGPNISACADYLRRRDRSRFINYFHAGTDECVDVVGLHYPSLEKIREFLAEEKSGRPVLLEEYAHSMGNGTGNMREYWELIETTPRLIGGFLWDWIDQGIERQTESGERWFAYGGDFGDTPNDGTFCFNGIVAPERRVKPALMDLKHTFRPFVFACGKDGGKFVLTVRNRYSFRNLNEFRTQINGALVSIDCAPGQTAEVDLARVDLSGETLDIYVFDHGYSVTEEQFPLRPRENEISSYSPLQLAEKNDDIIRFGPFTFCAETGMLKQWKIGSTELLADEIRFQAWRAPTCNDRPFIESWRKAGLDRFIMKTTRVSVDGNRITTEQSSDPFSAVFRYTLLEDALDLHCEFTPRCELPCLPRIGIRLILPDEFRMFSWYGRGPFETYRDRKLGAWFGDYARPVENLWYDYVTPQENGNLCDVTRAELKNESGTGIGLRTTVPLETSVHFWTAEEIEQAAHRFELPERRKTVWNIDYANAGVGNGSHGPGTLEKYRIAPGKITFSIRLESLRKS